MQSTGQVDKVKSGHMHVHYTTSAAPENLVSIHFFGVEMFNAFYAHV
jgi:hypothetical protein